MKTTKDINLPKVPPSSNSEEIVIEVKNLKKSFGEKLILKDVSFTLHKGENLVILGKSGSGKSVLVKCIVGLLKCDSGSINVLNQNVPDLNRKELDKIRQQLGFLFQSGALYDSMTVKENLEFPLKRMIKDLTGSQIRNRVLAALKNVGLEDALNKLPSQLSGGMRKRISLARTIIVNPLIMLYDEPTTGLDPITSDEINNLIIEVKEKYNTSSIIITHDIKCARRTADRIIMLKDGETYKEGKVKEFLNATDPYIMSFFS